MHMSDALLSPQVGIAMWAVTASTMGWSGRRLREKAATLSIPLMGVAGAFIFAAQMVNFTIPGTGSSGHLGGGMILAILLGPWAGFLTLASVLTIQALFFADGGLLALGCNIFNLGFFTCFLAYPLIYLPLASERPTSGRILSASILACTVALQMGSLGVVVQTSASGLAELPFRTFALVMQPIHLVIGLVEGFVTGLVINFIRRSEPGLAETSSLGQTPSGRMVFVTILLAALLAGGGLSLVASDDPDGLEWAVARSAGETGISGSDTPVHGFMDRIQNTLSFLPGYGFPGKGAQEGRPPEDPGTDAATSLSGLAGSLMTLVLVVALGFGFRLTRKRKSS